MEMRMRDDIPRRQRGGRGAMGSLLRRLLLGSLLLGRGLTAAGAAQPASTNECCDKCIGKVAASPYDYDPLVFKQCQVETAGQRVCCFDCGNLGDPSYGQEISYAEDGTTPTVKAGAWIKLTWTSATKVTYVTLKSGQKKQSTPTISDPQATKVSGYFMMCAKAPGSLIFRGWGNDTCRLASTEKTIEVLAGDANATCEAAPPQAPAASSETTGSSSAELTVPGCNLNRASVKLVDGEPTCVCVSDWTGAPSCDQMPVWKWIITIGGGVAALFSILISIRAFLKSREKKRNKERDASGSLDNSSKETIETIETIRIGEDRPSPVPSQTAYRRESDDLYRSGLEDHRGGRKRGSDGHEFTL